MLGVSQWIAQQLNVVKVDAVVGGEYAVAENFSL
jgi:hypothetical protein